MQRGRKLLFLRDVLWYTLTSLGGPQAHIGILLKDFVKKRRYVTEEELLELNALAQVLPGPSTTQTLAGIAYKVGGLSLALITFVIWILPSASVMSFFAISYTTLDKQPVFIKIMHYIQPITIGIVAYGAFTLAKRILVTRTAVWLAIAALLVTLILQNAYVFPILIFIGGIISSALETPEEENVLRFKLFSNVNRNKVLYYIGVLLVFATLGAIINRTSPYSLPIRLFENFYRNGILIFGGGQVMVPLMLTEFVTMKGYLTEQQFLNGYALQQALPGPTFSFTSFLGAMTLKREGYGLSGQITGSVLATIGINLPGLILVLFLVPFWNDLKKVSRIKNSLLGINAVSVGFFIAAFLFLLQPVGINLVSIALIVSTFLLLNFTKVRTPLLILAGILMGYFVR